MVVLTLVTQPYIRHFNIVSMNCGGCNETDCGECNMWEAALKLLASEQKRRINCHSHLGLCDENCKEE